MSFHFSEPLWLLALLLLIPVSAWLRRSSTHGGSARINRYADAHLMPYLSGSRQLKPHERRQRLTRWGMIWSLLVLAMAGPRWDVTEIQLYTPGSSLVVLLDISRSMMVQDEAPNRLTRARHEIEDLLQQDTDVRIGLVAFASVAHVVSPITDDAQSITHLLPALSTDLVRLQGSRLAEGLDRARLLLSSEPRDANRSILLISDGDFEQEELAGAAALQDSGIRLHVLGVGTPAGGPVPATMGWMSDPVNGYIQSRLEENKLRNLARAGGGEYLKSDLLDSDVQRILRLARGESSDLQQKDLIIEVWNERFYLFSIPAMLLLLGFFRRTRLRRAESRQ